MDNVNPPRPRTNFYLPLILLFILADVFCDNYVLRTFDSQGPSAEFFLFVGVLVLQMIASPIQAGFSDFYCRKKSIAVSLSFSLLSLIFVFFYFAKLLTGLYVLILTGFLKGAFGNTTPLSWAAIADTQEKNFRFSFGLSTASFAVGYLLLVFSDQYLKNLTSSIGVIVLYVVALVLCLFFFMDIRDKNDHKVPHNNHEKQFSILGIALFEIRLVFNRLKLTHIRNALFAFLLWEISQYSILLLYVDFRFKEFSNIATAMAIGYLLGVLILKLTPRAKDKTMILVGYYTSILSLFPFYIDFFLTLDRNYFILMFCYFFHGTGNALLSPTLFAILSKELKPHEQGKIYGLLESTDTVAFLLASISVMIYNFLKLDLIYIITLSFITVALAWFPYARFDKTRPKKLHTI